MAKLFAWTCKISVQRQVFISLACSIGKSLYECVDSYSIEAPRFD